MPVSPCGACLCWLWATLAVITELRSGLDVDKANVYIEDCISRAEPIRKVKIAVIIACCV